MSIMFLLTTILSFITLFRLELSLNLRSILVNNHTLILHDKNTQCYSIHTVYNRYNFWQLPDDCFARGMKIYIQCSTFRKKSWGQLAPKFPFFVARTSILVTQKLYLRINGFSFLRDNGLSLVYIFSKKKVTYLGGQVGDQS